MNKVSMQALNEGWALGFGTKVRQYDADFAYAAARPEATTPASATRKPRAFDAFLRETTETTDHLVARLRRRSPIDPMRGGIHPRCILALS